jgi:uncharacterized membrane protein YkoI
MNNIRYVCAAALAFALNAAPAFAEDKVLPAQQVIAAIQTATAAAPGQIHEVEVERKNGRLLVEVTVVGSDGKKREILVDPQNNQVVR